jgi:hypothetical protein
MELYERQFRPSAYQSGQAEAVVIDSIGGFDKPLITFDFAKWYTSAMDQPA